MNLYIRFTKYLGPVLKYVNLRNTKYDKIAVPNPNLKPVLSSYCKSKKAVFIFWTSWISY